MKGLKSFFWGGALLALLLTGCKGDIDYMIEEYNSRFGIHDDRLLPGDLNYNQNNMLEDEYHVDYDHTLNIPAPRVYGATYLWEVRQNGQLVKADYDGSHYTFQLYLPGAGGLIKGTYQLYLTMIVDGMVYTDRALVTVHEEDTN